MRFDFPTIMVALVAVSGVIWLVDLLFLARRRRARVATEAAEQNAVDVDELADAMMPKFVEYARSFFPVFLIVLVLRSFLFEPFRIPSGSMMPTLLIGDFILVNKFEYGIRLPVLDRKIVAISTPERGDVVVFRYPKDPSIPFIKRVVGLPGDRIEYRSKTLYVNGEQAQQSEIGVYVGRGSGSKFTGHKERHEQLEGAPHDILLSPRVLLGREGSWEVPEGHYFVLGDNRDNSEDSRYWNFVSDENLIGRAFMIWLSWDWGHGPSWGRIGNDIN
jgi:signal peptidase I